MPEHLPVFYKDLNDESFETALAVFHQRFSTNTWPQWRLAQPFRYLAHNGEINTVQGNRNWSVARGHKFESPHIPMEDVRPLVSMTGSDSNSMDNMLEALLAVYLFHLHGKTSLIWILIYVPFTNTTPCTWNHGMAPPVLF